MLGRQDLVRHQVITVLLCALLFISGYIREILNKQVAKINSQS